MPLRTRFALIISGLVLEVLAGFGVFLLWSERGFLLSQAEAQQEGMLRSLSRVARESYLSKDDLVLLNYIRSLPQDHPALAFAYVVRLADSMVVAHTDRQLIGVPAAQLPPRPAWARVLRRGVAHKESPLFEASLGFSTPIMEAQVADALVDTQIRILGIAALMLLVGVLTAVALAGTMTRPIRELMQAAAAIGQGRLKTRIGLKGKDELAQLASAFNGMAQKLEALDELKRDFTSSVTHELKSPLSAIESYLDLILFENKQKRVDVDRWVEYASYIKANTARLSGFISDLLDTARIERGQFSVNKVPSRLELIAGEVRDLFAPRAAEQRVSLHLQASRRLPLVEADPERIRQVMVNLVSNAIKFTPEGGKVTLTLDSEDGHVRFSVEDTGIGIPAEAMPRLFGKFEQLSGARPSARGPKGTGLGLFIAKTIIEAHGGRIWAESGGQGSLFSFRLAASPGPGD